MDFLQQFVIISISLVVGLSTLFALTIYLRNKKLKEEKNLIPIFSEIGGGRIGFFNLSYPFVRFSLYKDFLVFSSLFSNIIYYDKIKKINKHFSVFAQGIEVLTYRNNKHGRVIFFTFNNANELKGLINRLVIDYNNHTKD